jgi:hypothetical protein
MSDNVLVKKPERRGGESDIDLKIKLQAFPEVLDRQ